MSIGKVCGRPTYDDRQTRIQGASQEMESLDQNAGLMLLRLFASSADTAQAHALQAELVRTLVDFEATAHEPPQRYWKYPDLYEFTLRLRPANETRFDALQARWPGGWTGFDDSGEPQRSAVWKRAPGALLLLPQVEWAELILALD